MRSSWLYFATRSVRAGRAGLDLAAADGDREVGDRGVLGLAGAVAHHRAVAAAVRQVDRVERLGERADLVDLDQQRVGRASRRCRAASRSGLVTNRSSPTICTRSPSARGQRRPAVPVVLGQRVLDRDERVGVDQLARSTPIISLGRLRLLPSKRVAAVGVELGRRDVERERDVGAEREAGLLDGLGDQVERRRGCVGRFGREAALVAEAGGQALAPSAPT